MAFASVIYALVHPITSEIRYCGGTTQKLTKRLNQHITGSNKNNHHCSCWVRSLLKDGLKPDIILIQELNIKFFFLVEMSWIWFFRKNGIRLTNSTVGGEGAFGCTRSQATRLSISKSCTGKPKSDEAKKNMSLASKGISKSEEHIINMSLSRLGKPSKIKGIPKSEEHKKNLSIANKNYKLSDKTKENMRLSQKKRRKLELLNKL